TWSATGSLVTQRYFHTAALLPNGGVLVAGGDGNGYLTSAELYDPVAGTWSATGSMATARYAHTATRLPSGKVLVAGGYDGSVLVSAELYDSPAGTHTISAAAGPGGTIAPSGDVMVPDGSDQRFDITA